MFRAIVNAQTLGRHKVVQPSEARTIPIQLLIELAIPGALQLADATLSGSEKVDQIRLDRALLFIAGQLLCARTACSGA